MSRRFELRIDGDEFREMQQRASEVGCRSVAEYLRTLHRREREKLADKTIVDALSRASEPKVR